MKRFTQLTIIAVVLIACTGCIGEIIGSNTYDAVYLTVVGVTTRAPIKGATVSTTSPANNYTTNADGNVTIRAKFGQDIIVVTITYWTLTPSELRTKSVDIWLTNKAIPRTIIVQDDPHKAG